MILLRFERNNQKCKFHPEATFMMTSEILKFVDFTITQNSKYLENETMIFLKMKIDLSKINGYFMVNYSLVAEATFK